MHVSDLGVDLSRLRIIFTDVEKYAAVTGCESTAKAYKYFAEPGYLHKIKVSVLVNNPLSTISDVFMTVILLVLFNNLHAFLAKYMPYIVK